MDGTAARSRRRHGSAAEPVALLLVAALAAACGTDRPNAQHRDPGSGAPAGDPVRVTAAEPPGPHSGLSPNAPEPQPEIRYYACSAGQTAPNCVPVAASGAGAPAGATDGCAAIGTYESCIPVSAAAWVRARADPRNSWRIGRGFVCRVSF
jgi:hypothetical protein